jgi:hypothetical protein
MAKFFAYKYKHVSDFVSGLLVSQAYGGWSRELQGNNLASHEGIY